ncbi:hypothetical protein BK819_02375 [Microbacterium sp. LCT-H2]|nr:hypothetical protein BK819_02375 [Microbacterium sp. LCT-H2]
MPSARAFHTWPALRAGELQPTVVVTELAELMLSPAATSARLAPRLTCTVRVTLLPFEMLQRPPVVVILQLAKTAPVTFAVEDLLMMLYR